MHASQPRLDYFTVKPALIGELRALTQEREAFVLDRRLMAIVETRVSQINGCAYCTDLHSREARAAGVRTHELAALPVWRESPFFTSKDKAALAWAEALTLVAQGPASDESYARLQAHFSATEMVELSLCVCLANFWNRMAAGFRKLPVASAGDSDL